MSYDIHIIGNMDGALSIGLDYPDACMPIENIK